MSHETYQTDLSTSEWNILKPYLPPPSKLGRPRTFSFRLIINAIFYVVKTGCQWRLLPHDFPKWNLVYHYFRTWKNNGLWEEINDALREQVRIKAGRDRQPSAAIVDSQTSKESSSDLTVRHPWHRSPRVSGQRSDWPTEAMPRRCRTAPHRVLGGPAGPDVRQRWTAPRGLLRTTSARYSRG